MKSYFKSQLNQYKLLIIYFIQTFLNILFFIFMIGFFSISLLLLLKPQNLFYPIHHFNIFIILILHHFRLIPIFLSFYLH